MQARPPDYGSAPSHCYCATAAPDWGRLSVDQTSAKCSDDLSGDLAH